jgi:hypothetical protein
MQWKAEMEGLVLLSLYALVELSLLFRVLFAPYVMVSLQKNISNPKFQFLYDPGKQDSKIPVTNRPKLAKGAVQVSVSSEGENGQQQ